MKLSKLKNNPNNPRILKDDKFKKLVKSIKEFPKMMELRPMVIDKNNIVLGGNMRLKALKELGYKDIPNNWVKRADELTEAEKERFIIADNVGFGVWDWDELNENWDENNLIDWGLEIPEFEAEILEAKEDDYQEPETMQVDIIKGDLVEFICSDGRVHRLLCGDSTCSDSVGKLMNGKKADMAFTSPPYNAGTTPTELKMGKKSKYENDTDNKNQVDYLKLLVDFTSNSLIYSYYSFVNIQSLSGNKIALIEFLFKMKDVYADSFIWQKQTAQPAMAKNVLNSQFEYVHVFSKKANRAIGKKEFRGTISNVIEISKQSSNKIKIHNATFPIDFSSFFVSNFSIKSVLDLFLGSGTTMVAAHQLKRTCYGMELDEKYCQVIIDRMTKLDETLTVKINGKEYKKEAQNVPF